MSATSTDQNGAKPVAVTLTNATAQVPKVSESVKSEMASSAELDANVVSAEQVLSTSEPINGEITPPAQVSISKRAAMIAKAKAQPPSPLVTEKVASCKRVARAKNQQQKVNLHKAIEKAKAKAKDEAKRKELAAAEEAEEKKQLEESRQMRWIPVISLGDVEATIPEKSLKYLPENYAQLNLKEKYEECRKGL